MLVKLTKQWVPCKDKMPKHLTLGRTVLQCFHLVIVELNICLTKIEEIQDMFGWTEPAYGEVVNNFWIIMDKNNEIVASEKIETSLEAIKELAESYVLNEFDELIREAKKELRQLESIAKVLSC